MQIITYILTVCCAAILGVNMQGEAKSHKSKEHKHKSERHEKKHQKDKEIISEIPSNPVIEPIAEEVTAPSLPQPINIPVNKAHSPQLS